MSSTDESLRKHFEDNMRRKRDGQGQNSRGTLGDIIEWFKQIKVFDKLNILEADLTEAFNKLKTKASSFTYDDLTTILKELADKNNTNVEELKKQLLKLAETVDFLDRRLQEELIKGKASIKDVTDWLERHEVLKKVEGMEADVANAFDKVKTQVSAVNCEEFSRAMKDLAAKYNVKLEHIMKQLLDPGFLPTDESSDSES